MEKEDHSSHNHVENQKTEKPYKRNRQVNKIEYYYDYIVIR